MSKSHALSEDERIHALEQALPQVQHALNQLNDMLNSRSFMPDTRTNALPMPGDAILFEQLLGSIRTLYTGPKHRYPYSYSPQRPDGLNPETITVELLDPLATDPCIKVVINDSRIKGGLHRVMLRRTPGDNVLPTVDECATLMRAPAVNGQAVAIICCKQGRPGGCERDAELVVFLPAVAGAAPPNNMDQPVVVAGVTLPC